jgi:hypothetical protein
MEVEHSVDRDPVRLVSAHSSILLNLATVYQFANFFESSGHLNRNTYGMNLFLCDGQLQVVYNAHHMGRDTCI